MLRLYILPKLGDRRMDEVTPDDVQEVHNSLKSMPCAANYMRCVLTRTSPTTCCATRST